MTVQSKESPSSKLLPRADHSKQLPQMGLAHPSAIQTLTSLLEHEGGGREGPPHLVKCNWMKMTRGLPEPKHRQRAAPAWQQLPTSPATPIHCPLHLQGDLSKSHSPTFLLEALQWLPIARAESLYHGLRDATCVLQPCCRPPSHSLLSEYSYLLYWLRR